MHFGHVLLLKCMGVDSCDHVFWFCARTSRIVDKSPRSRSTDATRNPESLQKRLIGGWDHHVRGRRHCSGSAVVRRDARKIVFQKYWYPHQNKACPGRKESRQIVGKLSESRQGTVCEGTFRSKSETRSHSIDKNDVAR